MEAVKKLERIVGGRWHGVSLFGLNVECKDEFLCPHVDRYCEALKLAYVSKILLDPCQFTCPGARYTFGCGADQLDTIAQKLVSEKGYSPDYAQKLLAETPHCEAKPGAIGINIESEPNVLVSQLQPQQAMRLIQLYQSRLEKTFQAYIPSVLSACGNVTVRAIQAKEMAISMGCDDSRTFGGLTRDRFYVGLPYSLAQKLVRQ